MSAPPLDFNAIDHPIVKSAIEAMNSRNKKQWYELFSDNPAFTKMEIPMISPNGAKEAFWFFTGSLIIWPQSTKSRMGADYLWEVSLGSMGRFQDLSQILCGKWKDHQDGSRPNQLLKRDEIRNKLFQSLEDDFKGPAQ